MDMQASRHLGVTQQQAWEALNDPEVLKICIPGCDKVEATGENQFAVGLALKIGPVSAKFTGRITLSDVVPPSSYTISFEGQGGAAGHGKGDAKVSLTPDADGCMLDYTVHAQVGGKVAQLGQRLVDGAAKSIAESFFKRFDAEMQRRFPNGGAAAPAGSGGSAPPQAMQRAAAGAPAGPLAQTRQSQLWQAQWLWTLGMTALAVAWTLARRG